MLCGMPARFWPCRASETGTKARDQQWEHASGGPPVSELFAPVHLQQRLAVGHHLRLREEGVAVHRHRVALDAEVAAQLHVEADLQGAPAVKSGCCPRGVGIITVVRQMLAAIAAQLHFEAVR